MALPPAKAYGKLRAAERPEQSVQKVPTVFWRVLYSTVELRSLLLLCPLRVSYTAQLIIHKGHSLCFYQNGCTTTCLLALGSSAMGFSVLPLEYKMYQPKLCHLTVYGNYCIQDYYGIQYCIVYRTTVYILLYNRLHILVLTAKFIIKEGSSLSCPHFITTPRSNPCQVRYTVHKYEQMISIQYQNIWSMAVRKKKLAVKKNPEPREGIQGCQRLESYTGT